MIRFGTSCGFNEVEMGGVCVCVFGREIERAFIKLNITVQSGPVVLVILCRSR